VPIYEFRCETCDKQFECTVPFNTKVLCAFCCSDALTKLISVPAPPQFKGSGFYATDYKKKSPPSDK
jgi:putative FmdB family regulatory protein